MLSEKVAVITGAGPGLGRTLAGLMVEEGARVVVSARSRAALERTAAETGALAVAADVRDADQVRALARTTAERFGRIDVLVNAAFPGTHRKNVLDMDPAYLELRRSAVETATYGTLPACRYLAPYMVEGGGGSIVNVTSLSSRSGYAGRSDYATGKAGVHLLSHCLADEFGPLGIRVNCVAPGWIASDALTAWMETRAGRGHDVPGDTRPRRGPHGAPADRDRRGRRPCRHLPGERPGQGDHRRDPRRERRSVVHVRATASPSS
ncbi:SDR family NAD(P)-dependent oxidoreductase [Actinoallomurus soli]|nr:SDR family oxidoreductase [Actinoallomurus soli]MCO5971157.1 SDR family oxidoreductase [Actinoallomurus soli]